MRIAVPIIVIILLYAAGIIYYLRYEMQKCGEEVLSAFVGKEKKALGFLLLMMFLDIGLSIFLEKIYSENTLLTNLKAVILIAILSVTAVTDFKHHLIPNPVIIFGLLIRLIIAVIEVLTLGSNYFTVLKSDLISLAFPVFLFLMGTFVVKNGIGMGDIKLILVMGLFQGFTGVIASLFFALIGAMVIAIILLVTKKKGRKDTIPFGPALLFGTFIAVILTGI